MDIVEKLQIMLPHWIEHNRGHSEEFAQWAEQLDQEHEKLAAELGKAVAALDKAQHALEHALSLAGGPKEHGVHGDHHHGHHHH